MMMVMMVMVMMIGIMMIVISKYGVLILRERMLVITVEREQLCLKFIIISAAFRCLMYWRCNLCKYGVLKLILNTFQFCSRACQA